VDLSITDPVEKARAELKAALAAIEVKANVPRQLARVSGEARTNARRFSRDRPLAAAAVVVTAAAAIGALVWWGVSASIRR
jgi:hypothetical protein